ALICRSALDPFNQLPGKITLLLLLELVGALSDRRRIERRESRDFMITKVKVESTCVGRRQWIVIVAPPDRIVSASVEYQYDLANADLSNSVFHLCDVDRCL